MAGTQYIIAAALIIIVCCFQGVVWHFTMLSHPAVRIARAYAASEIYALWEKKKEEDEEEEEGSEKEKSWRKKK